MSYIEKKLINGRTYASFVKKISFMKKVLVIKKNIGIDSPTLNKEKYLIDNLKQLSDEEFDFRKKFLDSIRESISHDETLPERIEMKAIKINNQTEGKQCENILNTEFAKEFIFNSNNIEGSKIPSERVREIIDTGDTKYYDRNEVKEVQNSILAFEYLRSSFKFNIISVKKLYHTLTEGLLMENKLPYPKGFKKESNVIGNSTTTPPEKVEEEMTALMQWYRENRGKVHPLILAFEFHKRYESIHPFSDGNGRTGRMIMNKILISNGYPPMIVYKSNKQAYFNAIAKSREGRAKNYYQFMLEQADRSYDYLLDVITRY